MLENVYILDDNMHMEFEEMLSSLGLEAKESRTYLALLRLGESTISPLAKEAGLKRTSIYNFIDGLVAKGFVKRVKVRGRNHYSAVSPSALFDAQKQKVARLEQALPSLTELYESSTPSARVSYFEGSKEVQGIIREELSCESQASYIWPGEDIMSLIGGAPFMNEIDRLRIKRGVYINTIRFKSSDVSYKMGAEGKKYLRSLRWAPPHLNTSIGLGLYDSGKVGIIGNKSQPFGVLIENEDFYELMNSLFKLLWADCAPAKDGEGGKR